MNRNSDQEIINFIQQGNTNCLKELYSRYKKEWLVWAFKHFKVNEAIAEDIFQESVITFYMNVKSGKLDELTSTIKTYLFSIGKRKLLNVLRSKKPEYFDEDQFDSFSEDLLDPFEITEEQKMLSQAINQLGMPCSELLKLFYYANYSSESIANHMGYKNETVVRSQKIRCLQKLREIWKGLID